MEKFNLDTWLQDKSRKVVTRRGNSVRIICFDRKHGKDNLPVVFLEKTLDNTGEFLLSCGSNGKFDTSDTPYDLFFADEEEGLTEFEKELQIIISDASHWTSDYGSISTCCYFGDKEIKKISGQILGLARKELIEELSNDNFAIDFALNKGKQDALKDLPKWKKATKHKDLEKHIAILEDGKVLLSNYLEEGDYYIELEDLKTLPKEE